MRSFTCFLAMAALLGCSDRTRETGGADHFETTDASATPDASEMPDAGSTDTDDGGGRPDGSRRPPRDGGPADVDAGSAETDGGEDPDASRDGGSDASTGTSDAGPPVPCPEHDLGDALGESLMTASSTGASDGVAPSCGSGGGPDLTFLWAAPRDGTYGFDTNGSSFDTVISLRSGSACGGPELSCNDDGGEGLRSRALATLSAGDEVVISVDGFSGATGDVILNILEDAVETETACADGVDDDRDGRVDCDDFDCNSDPACTELDCTNGVDDDGDGDVDCADSDCSSDAACIESDCDNGLDDDGDGHVDCADRDCASEPHCIESDCADGVDDDGDGDIDCDDSDCFSSVECGETMCSDGADDDGDGRTDCDDSECRCDPACLSSDRCADSDIGMAVGASVAAGSNLGLCGYREGSCSGGAGAEISYQWTAPADGTFTFDTFGSDYDTQIYVLDGSCGGAELECNDDASGSLQSEVTVTLTAGQTVIVVVDGFSTRSRGDHVLNVTGP